MNKQFSTFKVGDRLFGIDVMQVQEVTQALPITPIPLAPKYVMGLMNLRGQLATGIDLRSLFGLEQTPHQTFMNVVCKWEGILLSLFVDSIGDVVEVQDADFEPSPDNVSQDVRQFMSGVYKTPGDLLSILEVPKISNFLNSLKGKPNHV